MAGDGAMAAGKRDSPSLALSAYIYPGRLQNLLGGLTCPDTWHEHAMKILNTRVSPMSTIVISSD